MKQDGEKGLKMGIRRELLQGDVSLFPTTGENWLRFSCLDPAPPSTCPLGGKTDFSGQTGPRITPGEEGEEGSSCWVQ